METPPGLLNPLASPALMVLASTAGDPSRGSPPCQQQQPGRQFGVDSPVPFLGASYSLAAMYHHSERLSGARDYSPSSSHLLPFPPPPAFRHPGLGGYGALRPFHTPPLPFPDEVERFSSAYAAAVAAASGVKHRTKLPVEPPQIRYLPLDKEGTPSSPLSHPPGSSSAGKRARTPAGHLRRTPSPLASSVGKREKRSEGALLSLRCPLCHLELTRADLRDHLRGEIERLAQLSPRSQFHSEAVLESLTQPPAQSLSPVCSVRPCDSPLGSPLSGDEAHKLDRQQIFQQVKTNREGRLGVRAGRCKRMKMADDEQLESLSLKGVRLPESEGDSLEDLEYRSPAQSSAHTLLDSKGCRVGTPPSPDSELEIDSDPDDSSHLTHTQNPIKDRVQSWDAEPSTLQEEGLANQGTGSARESAESLRAQISALTRRLQQRELYHCHVCLGSYSVPVASIQCWHIHCEDCWLRSLGLKKLCPQCSTITSPADLRRVYL
ncbi:E3 ubiquitin-protein ligase Rnf220-like [Huso huso]|uniref:E3 ubiquitin-protein ligase Rnf220-like n=1 Tax=Huso huso TaxID=61971 RepID=A0ABR0Y9S4_HUSHU